MAGHRRGRGPGGQARPRRSESRRACFERDVFAAPTGEQQLAVAFDYYRAAVRRSPRRAELMHEVATDLYARTRQLLEQQGG